MIDWLLVILAIGLVAIVIHALRVRRERHKRRPVIEWWVKR